MSAIITTSTTGGFERGEYVSHWSLNAGERGNYRIIGVNGTTLTVRRQHRIHAVEVAHRWAENLWWTLKVLTFTPRSRKPPTPETEETP